jgi:hypothetical protein
MYFRVSHFAYPFTPEKLLMPRKMFGLPITLALISSCAGFLLSHAMAQDQKLTGIAAWNQLVGNSITGEEDGKPLVEYYAPDGTAKSMHGNEISTGQWALVGETICFRYGADKDSTECYKVEVTGNTATYTDKDGTGSRYEILKGNPKGL